MPVLISRGLAGKNKQSNGAIFVLAVDFLSRSTESGLLHFHLNAL